MRSSTDAGDPSVPNTQLRAYLTLVVVILCWAANTVFARLAVGEISPMLLVSLRWAMVVMVLAAVARESLRKDWLLIRKNVWLFFALGALGFTAFNALFYVAAHTTTALNLGNVQGTMPADHRCQTPRIRTKACKTKNAAKTMLMRQNNLSEIGAMATESNHGVS